MSLALGLLCFSLAEAPLVHDMVCFYQLMSSDLVEIKLLHVLRL